MNELFLKIISGELPCSKIYEDTETFAFLDIKPCAKGHTLVVPKAYTRNLFLMNERDFGRLMETVHKVAHAVKIATNADGINIVINNEAAAGQEVFHTHVHIIPRHTNDGVFAPPKHETYTDGEMNTFAEKITSALI